MQDSGIPEVVRRFLTVHIDSVEQLEVLLLLRASQAREWSAAEVNREMVSSEASIRARLALLASKGFLTASGVEAHLLYRYEPSSAAVAAVIEQLATVYKERRIAVINLIYTKPESDAVSFSDAFKITRTKGDE